MELRIDLERSKTGDEYEDTGAPDRKTETILRQELRDEVILRTITVRVLIDDHLEWIGHLTMDYVPPNGREYTELPEPRHAKPDPYPVQANFPPPAGGYEVLDPR